MEPPNIKDSLGAEGGLGLGLGLELLSSGGRFIELGYTVKTFIGLGLGYTVRLL